MLNTDLAQQIKRFFSLKATEEQEKVVKIFSDYLISSKKGSVLVLRGYAGTGKTTLVSAFVKALDFLGVKSVLLGPTGRSAKVFSRYASHTALTIHKKIYRQQAFTGDTDGFSLGDNLHRDTIFIVDEASMISGLGLSGGTFGSGRLLEDLLSYVYSGDRCRLMLIGDTAQLPPVGEEESPALSTEVLSGYGLDVTECSLTQVVRQGEESGILFGATRIRQMITDQLYFTFPVIRVSGFPDLQVVTGGELIETISECYDKAGMDETIIVCRSNKRANIYNKGIRNTVLYREDELCAGDVLMVAKNNYFWSKDCKEMDFIANGDTAIVRRVRREQQLYGFRFATVLLQFPDYNDLELEVKVLLDTLHSEAASLTREESEQLFRRVEEDYADVTVKRERMKKIKVDEFYNALQVKYAYAVTCHKAQGGQWRRVFIDQGYVTEEMLTPDYFRWLYTAFTRATEKLYLVNWPARQTEEPM